MFSDRLRVPCSLQTRTSLSTGCRVNLDSFLDITFPQSSTAQFTCWRHHFNRAPLDWTDKGAQTRGTRAYRPFMFSLRRKVVANIILPIAVATIDITYVEVDRRFRLVTTEIYRSSAWFVILGQLATGLRTNVWLVWNCFHNREMT
ncbi:hypothetical protein AVEN_36461-1 [Araneus ventricosus]|uniref:Uncharacterized protein n=1 Tax=Araneus ventricosus TaxID=182803 RepID=A0A4Y2QWS1_ARAVE|nr:hypothetical protein AVEN_36461-1 [Araneus ventricosus]